MALPLIGKKDRRNHRKRHKASKGLTATTLSKFRSLHCPVMTVKHWWLIDLPIQNTQQLQVLAIFSYFSRVPGWSWQTRVWPQQLGLRLSNVRWWDQLRGCSAPHHPGLAPATDKLLDLIHVPYLGVLDKVRYNLYLLQGRVQRPLHQISSLQWANPLRFHEAKRHKSFPGRDKKHYTHRGRFAAFRCKNTLAVYQSQLTR